MAAAPASPDAPVERFRPTNGVVIGWVGIAVAVAAGGLGAVAEPNRLGVSTALGAALAVVAIWTVLVRPRATAYADTLVLQNAVTDFFVPLARIDDVVVRHTLNVWVDGRRYVCTGIGRSSRNLMRHRGRGPVALVGVAHSAEPMGMGDDPPPGSPADYAGFVETRIAELARAARRDAPDRGTGPARRVWARRPIGTLLVLAVAFGVSLLG